MRGFSRLPLYVLAAALAVTFVNGLTSKLEVSYRSWGTMTMESNYGKDWQPRMAGARETNAPLYFRMAATLNNAELSPSKARTRSPF
jgi:hypothetical protein